MLRSRFTLAVLLAVACADGPTAPDVARAPPTTGLAFDAVAVINRLLDDPVVDDLTAQTDQSVEHAMQDVMDRVAEGEPQAIRRALDQAQQALHQSTNDEAVVARAALGLTLEAVQTVLDSVVETQTDESEPFRRGGHDD